MNANQREHNAEDASDTLQEAQERLPADAIRVDLRSLAADMDWTAWAAAELKAAGIEEARFEAQLLLALVLGVSRSSVVAHTYAPLDARQQNRFADLVSRRARRVPFAYLRGTQEFYGREFAVTPAVLVPRPETELAVETVLDKIAVLAVRDLPEQDKITLADVGTGSGCIAVSVAAERAKVWGVAFDISPDALAVAQLNAHKNGVAERVRFVRGDLLTGAMAGAFDVVVSNPPYIPTQVINGLEAEVRDFEPRLALDGGRDGLDMYRRLAVQSERVLKPGGWLVVEVGQEQAGDVSGLMGQAGFLDTQAFRDLAGIERVVCGQKQTDSSQTKGSAG